VTKVPLSGDRGAEGKLISFSELTGTPITSAASGSSRASARRVLSSRD
jgi:hypothetical protein